MLGDWSGSQREPKEACQRGPKVPVNPPFLNKHLQRLPGQPVQSRGKCDLFDANWQILQHMVLLRMDSCIFEFSTSKCSESCPPFVRHGNDMLEM